MAFFRRARSLYPRAHLRLYTAGDLLDAPLVDGLAAAGLDEVRVSIKEEPGQREKALRALKLAVGRIPAVWVEMPVLPQTALQMEHLLLRLDAMGVDGINLLERCYPFTEAEEFQRRGYALKRPLSRVIYDYWYAGGAAVAGSEREALSLLAFAAARRLRLAVHYCSLENKHTAQIYEQNGALAGDRFLFLSPRDFFLKTAKCFGEDAVRVRRALRKDACRVVPGGVEFPVRHLRTLPDGVQAGVSYYVVEQRAEGPCLRELLVVPYEARDIKVDADFLAHL